MLGVRPPRLNRGVRLTGDMSRQRTRVLAGLVLLYWVAIIVGVAGCLALPDADDYPFWVGLFVLTLPWSLVPWWFTWALMHQGVGAGFLVGLGIAFAVLNSGIMGLVSLKFKRKHDPVSC